MVSLPFLNFHHSFPLPTFYTEWSAFALGIAALCVLAFAPQGKTRVPPFSLGLIGLVIALLVQIALGTVAYVERSLLAMLYLLWAAMLAWVAAHLRERVGIGRLVLTLQAFVAVGGLLVAVTGFALYYRVDLFGFRLSSGVGEGMFGAIGQRNNFANYLGCALASVVYLYGRNRLKLPAATLVAIPLVIALVLSTSRAAFLYVSFVVATAFWTYRAGDREQLRPLWFFSLFVALLFVGLTLVTASTSWLAPGDAHGLSAGERLVGSFASSAGQYDFDTRLYFIRESWAMFAAHPVLGAGFGEFAWNLLARGADPQGGAVGTHVHNALLELLAETGIAGTGCVLVPVALWLRFFPWRGLDPYHAWILTLVAVETAHSALEFPLWHANFLGLTAVVLGVVSQPGVAVQVNRLRRIAFAAVLAGGALTLLGVLSDYRAFERWYRGADASLRRGVPLTAEQVDDLERQRAQSLFAGNYDLLAAELLPIDRSDLDAKLELNARVLRFVPIPTAVFRQAALLNLKGEHEGAMRMLSRLVVMYPDASRDLLKRLDRMAFDDPAAFGKLASEARRRYRR
jgi:O-antigen ligase